MNKKTYCLSVTGLANAKKTTTFLEEVEFYIKQYIYNHRKHEPFRAVFSKNNTAHKLLIETNAQTSFDFDAPVITNFYLKEGDDVVEKRKQLDVWYNFNDENGLTEADALFRKAIKPVFDVVLKILNYVSVKFGTDWKEHICLRTYCVFTDMNLAKNSCCFTTSNNPFLKDKNRKTSSIKIWVSTLNPIYQKVVSMFPKEKITYNDLLDFHPYNQGWKNLMVESTDSDISRLCDLLKIEKLNITGRYIKANPVVDIFVEVTKDFNYIYDG